METTPAALLLLLMPDTFAGIEIGGTKLQIAVGDSEAHIINCLRFNVRAEQGAQGILNQIATVLREWQRHHLKLKGICIGFGGPVNTEKGCVLCSHQIQGWDHFDFRSWIQDTYGDTSFYIENDANTAAFAEAIHGAGIGYNPILYVTLGSGVGGGAVVNGHIFHGAPPGEIEVGHLRLDKNGRTVESACSGWAVDQAIQRSIAAYPDGTLAKLCNGRSHKQAEMLLPALQANDPEAHRILCETADNLVFGLSHAVHLIHPQAIILGGGLSLIGEPLRAAIASALPSYLMDAFQPGPTILLAKLGEQTVPVGALALAIENSKES